jgi:drug/metabolite transporter (DMT)-like permease
MLPAFLTTVLFSVSVVTANRTTRALGGMTANFYRLVLATAFLALWAHTLGQGFSGGAAGWFFLSGMIGFGLGDLALYQALPRIGARLTILLVQCLAAPFAALAEWTWLGTALTGPQILWGLIILAGVALAVAPSDHLHIARRALVAGLVLGIIAALGQGLGAVVSRKAYAVIGTGLPQLDGLTAAYQRILGGLLVGAPPALWLMLRERARAGTPDAPGASGAGRGVVWPWVVANSLAGPTVGVGCYQWALATEASGIVLPIVATTPIVVIPFAYLLEGDRPSLRSLLGGFLAVAGAVGLALAP